jgi:hypothetical protein
MWRHPFVAVFTRALTTTMVHVWRAILNASVISTALVRTSVFYPAR